MTARPLLLVLTLVLAVLPRAALAEEPRVAVLFVGNSYTYGNDLPKMLETLATAGGNRLNTARSVRGGFTLQKHWQEEKAVELIKRNRWDVVVLQEQSQMPLVNPPLMFEYAKKLDEVIDERGARTMFFLTWAREHLPEMQKGLNESYFAIAEQCEAEVAPVGIAWQKALALEQPPQLHQPDKSHPTKFGTYLAACVFYAAIFGESPEGLPGKFVGLTDEQARVFQRIAWEAVRTMDEARSEPQPDQ